jgi:hypothetical protein
MEASHGLAEDSSGADQPTGPEENQLIDPAPAYPIEGKSLKTFVKFCLNIPIKIFGRRQTAFNAQVKEALEAITRKQEDQRIWIEEIKDENKKWMDSIAEKQDGQNAWLTKVGETQERDQKWVSNIWSTLNGVEKELRLISGHAVENRIEPHISDQAAYSEKLLAMGEDVRINVGCGLTILPDYINVDMRDIDGVEVVAEATNLPWENGALAEIASFHLVEHFAEYELTSRVLPYWHKMLKDGGNIRITTPNWEAILRKLNEGDMDMERFKELTFGGQEYEGNDHMNALTPKTLTENLLDAGFVDIEIVCEERDNSGCPEMEITARKGFSPSG